MRYLLAVVAVLGGCAYEIPGEAPVSALYAAETAAVERAWAQTYAEPCDLAGASVATADGEQLEALCAVTPTLRGCHSRVPRPARHVVVIAAAYVHEARNTVTHELLHICAESSGVFPDDQPEHDDAALWGGDGILARVNAELGLPSD